MNECYACGISEDKAVLYEGIHRSFGVVKVCRKCYFKEKLPLVEKKSVDLEEIQRRPTVRERLSAMAGLKVRKEDEVPKRHVFTPEDVGLKDIVDKNLKNSLEAGPKDNEDLIDNWNWVIMRKRRALKLSYSQLGEIIQEQPVILEALEKGKLPRGHIPLIKKLENYLQTRLFKDQKVVGSEGIMIESKVPSGMSIADLKEKTRERKRYEEERVFDDQQDLNIKDFNLEKVKEITGEPEDSMKKSKDKGLDELTDEEINDLIFGRKK